MLSHRHNKTVKNKWQNRRHVDVNTVFAKKVKMLHAISSEYKSLSQPHLFQQLNTGCWTKAKVKCTETQFSHKHLWHPHSHVWRRAWAWMLHQHCLLEPNLLLESCCLTSCQTGYSRHKSKRLTIIKMFSKNMHLIIIYEFCAGIYKVFTGKCAQSLSREHTNI